MLTPCFLNSCGGELLCGVYADPQADVQLQESLCHRQLKRAHRKPSSEPHAHGSLMASCLPQAWSGAACHAWLWLTRHSSEGTRRCWEQAGGASSAPGLQSPSGEREKPGERLGRGGLSPSGDLGDQGTSGDLGERGGTGDLSRPGLLPPASTNSKVSTVPPQSTPLAAKSSDLQEGHERGKPGRHGRCQLQELSPCEVNLWNTIKAAPLGSCRYACRVELQQRDQACYVAIYADGDLAKLQR